jgi:hypothetical protein
VLFLWSVTQVDVPGEALSSHCFASRRRLNRRLEIFTRYKYRRLNISVIFKASFHKLEHVNDVIRY